MKSLDEDLPTLLKLSDYRKRAEMLRDAGREALKLIDDEKAAERNNWRISGDKVETALVVQVQSKEIEKKQDNDEDTRFVTLLRNLKLDELFGGNSKDSDTAKDDGEVPVLLAARTMRALAATSKHAFSRATLLCYYRIVRELYSADSPDWSTGGAKAGSGGESTAFITGECVRAISAFARTNRQTAIFFKRTFKMYKRKEHLLALEGVGRWRDSEMERIALAWYTSTNVHLGEIALKLPQRPETKDKLDMEYVDTYLKMLITDNKLRNSIREAKQSFIKARNEITRFRQKEKRATERSKRQAAELMTQSETKLWKKTDQRYMRSESAHQMAFSVVKQAIDRADEALKRCGSKKKILNNLSILSDLFAAIDCEIKKILEPAKRFLGTLLDRELAAASATGQSVWDARELIFAAASYGAVTDWKQDERLKRACGLLCEVLSERGLFPAGRPFHSTSNGYNLHPNSFEVARGFAQLLQAVDFPVTPQLIERMLQLFEDNSILHEPKSKQICWHPESPPIPKKPTLWATALAVLALDRIVRMLDHKINEGILRHFSAVRYDKDPQEGKLSLETLAFPDYALSPLSEAIKNELPPEQQRDWSVAISLEQMRAHVMNTNLPLKYLPLKFSSVLFGPPGTGKTTLLEALARSCSVPLVQITPSDIARAGEQEIEKSAKIIFDALAMLTRVVIIFDEFEPILLKRETDGAKEERSIFTFLTPGMLPKLKKLYEAAKQQRIAYCLVTNHYEKLDKAAIRRGRFDEHIAIYHPDYLSRAGIFLDNLAKHPKGRKLNAEQKRRFEEVIKWTTGASIQDLVKDLKVPPDKDLDPKTNGGYVLSKQDKTEGKRAVSQIPFEASNHNHDSSRLGNLWKEMEHKLSYDSLWKLLKE